MKLDCLQEVAVFRACVRAARFFVTCLIYGYAPFRNWYHTENKTTKIFVGVIATKHSKTQEAMSKISTTQKQTVEDNYDKLGDLFRRDKSWEYHKSRNKYVGTISSREELG